MLQLQLWKSSQISAHSNVTHLEEDHLEVDPCQQVQYPEPAFAFGFFSSPPTLSESCRSSLPVGDSIQPADEKTQKQS